MDDALKISFKESSSVSDYNSHEEVKIIRSAAAVVQEEKKELCEDHKSSESSQSSLSYNSGQENQDEAEHDANEWIEADV